jgi:hypothetical protein
MQLPWGSCRFVHAADIHLDSRMRSLALRDPDLAELIGNASRRAFATFKLEWPARKRVARKKSAACRPSRFRADRQRSQQDDNGSYPGGPIDAVARDSVGTDRGQVGGAGQ